MAKFFFSLIIQFCDFVIPLTEKNYFKQIIIDGGRF